MPFTFSHPAAVLPLIYVRKPWFSLTGLVMGSLAPDFDYFIRMRVHSSFSHSWTGVFWFDLPLAMILASLFHLVVRDKFIDSLPQLLQSRFVIFKELNWKCHLRKKSLVVPISCLIGTATHILWDSFTHPQGHFVQTFSCLQQSLFISGYSIPIYKILQHASSLLGALLIIYIIGKLPVSPTKNRGINWCYWAVVVCFVLAVLTLRALMSDHVVLGNMIVSAISGGLLGLLLTPAILLLWFNGK